jgi:hypothetical protein
MAESIVTFASIGSPQSSFSFSFSYLAATDIDAFVDGTSVFANNASTGTAVGGNTYTVAFSSSGSKTLTFSPAVPQGSTVRIERNTALTSKAVDFSDGAVLTELALDSAIDQVFFATQESNDKTAESIKVTADGKFDAISKVIKNVADPSSAQDAATKNYVDTSANAAATSATNAANSATASASSATTSTTQATNSSNSATASANSATASANSATASANSATASANSASAASTSESNASTSASTSSTQATNSTNSATASANSATASAGSASTASTQASNASTSATLSGNYANKTDGAVAGSEYSAKAWALGGTGVTDTAGSGGAKEWATDTTNQVDGTEYSAKEYAIGSQAGNTAGSAKQWAIGGGGSYATNTTVDGANYSAKYWAEVAASHADAVDDIYLGSKSSNPTLDNDGNALQVGALYYNSGSTVLRVWNGSAWEDAVVSTSGFASAGFSIAMSIAL